MVEAVKRGAQGSGAKKKMIRVYDPTNVAVIEKHLDFAPRINSFDGKRVGLLWNGKPNGDFYLNRVAILLKEKYQDINIIKFWEVDPEETAHPDKKSDAALDRIAKESDIVIAAQGD